MTFQLRAIQDEKSKELVKVLNKFKLAYLSGQTRSGKTLCVLNTADLFGAKDVLFITKKKAISSIESDYNLAQFTYKLTVINYESVHKIDRNNFDLVICDESHSCFLGSTKIDGLKIKDIPLGYSLKSFNFEKGIYEKRKVLNKFKKPLNENLIKIKCNGKEIVCTENNEIYTRRGWVKAKNILPTDELQVV